jgi:thioredoxin family protein
MRKGVLIIWLALLFSGIIALFWYNEWVYALPTPVPKNYKAVHSGETINLSPGFISKDSKPVFLHFFNPDCPCSKFNIPHFKSLVKQYSNEVNFAIVVMSKKQYTAKEIQEKFGLSTPVLFDTAIAIACGVYSTPQAVLLDASHKLYYRGNYNRSRYCADPKSNYAQMAIEGLLHNNYNLNFNQLALQAYGCRLPNCTK